MSFELTNALTIFQELINHVLYDHLNEFVITYLNNILIFSRTEKKYKKHVKKVLKKFQKKNFYLKLKKCEFHKQQVKYLEYIVTIKKLKMNSEKIKAVLKFSISECVKNIQTF